MKGKITCKETTLSFYIKVVSESVTQQDDDAILKCLIELAENVPKFLRPQVENVLTFCMKVSDPYSSNSHFCLLICSLYL